MSVADSLSAVVQNVESPVNSSQQKDENAQKQLEREERLRMARERLAEEQKRKFDEFRESMARSDEFRRKQEEDRRKKIEETKRRDKLRRTHVEERRKRILEEENERKNAILRKTSERDVKLEQSKQRKLPSSSSTLLCPPIHMSTSAHDVHMGTGGGMGGVDENYNQILKKRKTLTVIKKRLSVSVGQISRNRRLASTTLVNSQSNTEILELENLDLKKESSGSMSPVVVVKGRTKSGEKTHKSRVDMKRTFDRLNILKSTSSISQSTLSADISATGQLSRSGRSPTDSNRATSKSNGKNLFSTPPPKMISSSSKMLLNTRSMPKSIKELRKKSITMNPGVLKASHNLVIQSSNTEKGISSVNAKEQKTDGATVEKKTTTEAEYKSKLDEKRRLAREKAAREAEEKKDREEKRRKEEEERVRIEEEEEMKKEDEELRALEEAKKQEEERFCLAVQETERKQKDEEEKMELEHQEKLSSEQKAQEDAEKKEKVRVEKSKREEDERLERKKRIELIMKRIKTDETGQKIDSSTVVSEMVEDSGSKINTLILETSQFRSPLLQQMMKGNKLKGALNTTSTHQSNDGDQSRKSGSTTHEKSDSDFETESQIVENERTEDDALSESATEVIVQSQINVFDAWNDVANNIGEDGINEILISKPSSNDDSQTMTILSHPNVKTAATCHDLIDVSFLDQTTVTKETSLVTKETSDCIESNEINKDLPLISFEKKSIPKHSNHSIPDILLL